MISREKNENKFIEFEISIKIKKFNKFSINNEIPNLSKLNKFIREFHKTNSKRYLLYLKRTVTADA